MQLVTWEINNGAHAKLAWQGSKRNLGKKNEELIVFLMFFIIQNKITQKSSSRISK